MHKQDFLLVVIVLLLGVLIVELGAFGRFPAPALNAWIVGQAADLRVVDVAAADRASTAELEERVHRRFRGFNAERERVTPQVRLLEEQTKESEKAFRRNKFGNADYLVRQVKVPSSGSLQSFGTEIRSVLSEMSQSGHTLVGILPIVEGEIPAYALVAGNAVPETRTVGAILIGKREREGD